MAEDFENGQQEEQEEEKSIWELLEMDDSSKEDYEEEQEEMDEQIAKEDKLEKKLSAKMENMQKKFESTLLRERISKFENEADELTLDMFKTVASDVKSLEDFDKAMNVVKKQADQLRKTAEEYKAKLEQEAAQQTAAAWGTGPLGTPVKRGDDEVKKQREAIEKGDTHAALSALLEGDPMVGGVL